MRKPNVLFLIQHPDLPSSRVRVLDLLPALEANGIQPQVEPYPSGMARKARLVRSLSTWDAVVVQKKLPSPAESRLLRMASKRLVYDLDDAVYQHHESVQGRSNFSRQRKFEAIARQAHLVLAGNQTLADAVRPYNDNIAIIPSAVPVLHIPQHDHTQPHTRCIIGWVGGCINLTQLALLRPVLADLHARHKIELRILSSEPIDMSPTPTTFIPWSLEKQTQEIAHFDIGVMPLPPSAHASAKCGYKALQYMAACVPPVVSDTPCNRKIVDHAHEGFVAESWRTFAQHLETLIQNPALRHQFGHAARRKVVAHYSIETVGQQVAAALHHLVRQPHAHRAAPNLR